MGTFECPNRDSGRAVLMLLEDASKTIAGKRASSRALRPSRSPQAGDQKVVKVAPLSWDNAVPINDATPAGLAKLRSMNVALRQMAWPEPYDRTTHKLRVGDARDLQWIADKSVHLVVTSPPYWTLKEYAPNERQMGAIEDYDKFLSELDRVWAECAGS